MELSQTNKSSLYGNIYSKMLFAVKVKAAKKQKQAL